MVDKKITYRGVVTLAELVLGIGVVEKSSIGRYYYHFVVDPMERVDTSVSKCRMVKDLGRFETCH